MGDSTAAIRRVLIANRGAISVRIARTLQQMDIVSVAVFAEADRQSLHVRAANEAVALGSGNSGETYLNSARILEIAKAHQIDAIHPGYGFLSENSAFVEQCEAAGIAFIGPTAQQIEAFGLKHRARELATAHGVPLLPGTQVLRDVEDAIAQAADIGYPVMLKSSAGGGGIGMQLCHEPQELRASFESVASLSQSNFANADLFLEKFVVAARHIEVQIFGDGRGGVIALGERDCSAQRRNQKVIEETPAPNLADSTRQALAEVACRLAAAVHYRSAGTVEFIVDAETEAFYFLEVNTRLQVEHGVTEMVYGVDIVRWMTQLAAGDSPLPGAALQARGHAIQARVYAEDPARQFQPSAGLLSAVTLPKDGEGRRVDHWIEAGLEVSPFYDPMLAKVIAHADDRQQALGRLDDELSEFSIYGIETNIDYLRTLLKTDAIAAGQCLTSTLASTPYTRHAIEVLRAGTMTTIQDYPGRGGYWPVGIPPSGPFDDLSFRRANQLLGNQPDAAGLEMTLDGVSLRFLTNTTIALTGANMSGALDGVPVEYDQPIAVTAGQTLVMGKVDGAGMRCYMAVQGGLDTPPYLGSRATFTLGKFGGHAGRTLRAGDMLRLFPTARAADQHQLSAFPQTPATVATPLSQHWQLHVIAGPQGSVEFFSANYLRDFYAATWSVHFNSSRTGIRLTGPKPEWARSDGGEAGMHPSNLHDNAYAFGTIDFTGDMPVILGPDGPSLGGFVCPATVASADRWKLGQLKAGDTLQFVAVTRDSAVAQLNAQAKAISDHTCLPVHWQLAHSTEPFHDQMFIRRSDSDTTTAHATLPVNIRRAGDSWLLIEFGDMVLDIELRFIAQRFMQALEHENIDGVVELTPGIRSVQIHYDCLTLAEDVLIERVKLCCNALTLDNPGSVVSRIVHLPLSWDDEQCRIAIEKYDQVVRKDAPWYPSNLEFIRRINGLDSIDEVKKIVFDASYLVLGLGDVYLGAPVATPVDPRHRLVTTKYNPARTWTAENSVGIGGSYLCIYGMEGPGGYQFVGRTLQMWNIYHQTSAFQKPWLLRFFDQIRFYPVSGEELAELRDRFPLGQHEIKIEHTEFDLAQYKQYLSDNTDSIDAFTTLRQAAFDAELQHWKDTGQFQFEETATEAPTDNNELPDGIVAVESPAAGSVWKLLVAEGDCVTPDRPVMILESMKMEIEIQAGRAGKISQILCSAGTTVEAGSRLLLLTEDIDQA